MSFPAWPRPHNAGASRGFLPPVANVDSSMDRKLSLPRGALLFALALLHLVVQLMWRPVQRPAADWLPRREGELVFLLPPPPRPQTPSAPPAERVRRAPERARPPQAERDAETGRPTRGDGVAQEALPQRGDDPFAVPEAPAGGASAESLLARARSAAGKADRDLRKERRETLALREPELARKMAAAYIDRSHKITETVLSNGDAIMKVQSPFGTYCWIKWGSQPGPGRDPIRDAGKQFAVPCPK
ncbi:hypothetical protein ACHMW6_35545 [Pseudoduganella sp. UC29_106]|uniref:hypothetical protein n=1 Tax=Pseudoduganella sp. UC29_106 TaxID=3374553 RepID=UPI003757125C